MYCNGGHCRIAVRTRTGAAVIPRDAAHQEEVSMHMDAFLRRIRILARLDMVAALVLVVVQLALLLASLVG